MRGVFVRAALGGLALLAVQAAAAQQEDHFQWLEEVQGRKALQFAADHSQRTEASLRQLPGFDGLVAELREVLESPDRLAPAEAISGQLYNFWRDREHPRGIWRRSPAADYLAGQPRWQTVLDLDALAKAEGEPWTWGGARCIEQPRLRCMVALSRGGGDAKVQREFDPGSGRFVAGGFMLPESKNSVAWIDPGTLAVATDFGAGSLTESGYPRQLKAWSRGQTLAQARLLLETPVSDVGLWVWSTDRSARPQLVVERRIGFFTGKQLLLRQGRLQEVPKPDHAQASLGGERLLLDLRGDWHYRGRAYPAGSLLALPLRAFMDGHSPAADVLFEPGERRALHSHLLTRSGVVGLVQDEQGQQLVEWRRGAKGWQMTQHRSANLAGYSIRAYQGSESDRYWLVRSSFLQPTELALGELGSARQTVVQRLPAFFDSQGLEVQRLFAVSGDGTRIPYYLVQPTGPVPAGGRPTVLYGYGGFEISLQPGYSGVLGRAWLQKGGAYAVANLRGGGEFGPAWHQSAQKQHRQRSFNDFTAVAADLIDRGLSGPKRLGILGGSLGGLLTSVAMVQKPELFGAVVSQVPLTDMRRYHKLLAGHSWIAEYGNPDVPEEWAYISAYSPYQQAQAQPAYPPVLYTSSTLDDRVHPGHARKMVARLQELGQPVWYWENREGGHAGASDMGQTALMWALTYGFFQQQLMTTSAKPASP
ncbi:prolyl oligopeptidase family protein [Roseateles sp.]|jgi:prolyl oligopeptidase|uniref:prolyl oligopeptidase family protein n=1 Tax=Roseateles sp. TaxID=1971397 RepID=UPI0037C52014